MYRILDEHNKMSPRWENEFYQWDSDRKLVVLDASVEEVHFTNRTMENALVKTVYKDEETGYRLVDVPNILFQSYKAILVYGYDKDSKCTTGCTVFKVNKRKKPDDYVYTETEVFKYSELEERVTQLEEKEVEVDLSEYYTKDETEEFVKQTVAENKVEVVVPDLSQNDPNQPDYVKNRTHWLERPYEPIVWDGSTEGRDSIDVSLAMGYPEGTAVAYKIAEYIPIETLVGSKVCVSTAFETAYTEIDEYTTVVDGAIYSIRYFTVHDDGYGHNEDWASGFIIVSAISGDFSGSMGVVIPSAGIYAVQTDIIPHMVDIDNDEYHSLDEKYLPDLKLAAVAKTGEYNDLSGRPITVSESEGYCFGDCGNEVKGYNSLAVGCSNIIETRNSIAIGERNDIYASGNNSGRGIALGSDNKIYGLEHYGFVIGRDSSALYNDSYAIGTGVTAKARQNVAGYYNIGDSRNKYVHIFGNGTGENDRSNAHTLDWNGVGWFKGGLKVGGTGQDDEAAVDVLTTKDRVQPDLNQNDPEAADYVKGRTHYEIPPKFDIRWDGDMTGKFAFPLDDLGMPGAYLVKVSDLVLTPEEMVGAKAQIFDDGYFVLITITENDIDSDYLPGAYSIQGSIAMVFDATSTNAAAGLPDGTLTNGVYFLIITARNYYISQFCGPVEVVKLDEKYLPDKVMSGIVRYDVSMVRLLSEQEKTQARGNIGAANALSSVTRESAVLWLGGIIGAANFENSTIPELKNNITTYIDLNAFTGCTYLRLVDLPNLEYIGEGAFKNCTSLFALILRRSDKIVTLANTNAFKDSIIYNGGKGYIYVPASMVDAYKADEKWSHYASQIRAIEDYPGITGG